MSVPGSGIGPSLAVLAHLRRNDCTALGIAKRYGLSRDNTYRVLYWLHHEMRAIHICAYTSEGARPDREVPVYRWGHGEDAQRQYGKPGPARTRKHRQLNCWRKALSLIEFFIDAKEPSSITDAYRAIGSDHKSTRAAILVGVACGVLVEMTADELQHPRYAMAGDRASEMNFRREIRRIRQARVEARKAPPAPTFKERNAQVHQSTLAALRVVPRSVFELADRLRDAA